MGDLCTQELEPTLAMLVDLHCGAKQVCDSDENIWGHFLAEGFGKILQVNPKVFVHWHLGTGSMPPANFVDTSCKIRKFLVDTSLASNGLNVGCRYQLQLISRTFKEDAGHIVPVCIGHHCILVFRQMLFHPICFHVAGCMSL